jgi:outer membrane protein OmpA-like peptidoglycan-associated protein
MSVSETGRGRSSGRWVRHGSAIVLADPAAEELELAFEAAPSAPPGLRWVQEALNILLGRALAVDGISGSQTRRAIVDFQGSRGLVADGIAGPATAGALREALLSVPSAGEPCAAVAQPAEELVAFAFDDHRLQPRHLVQSGKLARCAAASKATSVRIVGHTDPVGDDSYNLTLGLRRAEEVAKAMREALDRQSPGASARIHFDVDTRGEAEQIPGPREQNRRVQVFVPLAKPPQPRRRRRPPGRVPPTRASLVLRIDRPTTGELLFIEPGTFPTSGPSMPAVTVMGTVLMSGQQVPGARIEWRFEISGHYRRRAGGGPVEEPYQFDLGGPAVTVSGSQDFVEFSHLGKDLIVGGTLEVTATARVSAGSVIAKRRCAVLGRNPARVDVEAMLRQLGSAGMCGNDGWALMRIFCHESAHRLEQFRDGRPLIGPPAGVGIVQRDPGASEWIFPHDRLRTPNNFFPDIYWNWHKNVREGVAFFRGPKLAAALQDLAGLRAAASHKGRPLSAPCPGVKMRAAIRRYNGGSEYRSEAVPGQPQRSDYVVRQHTTNPAYVDLVLGDAHVTDPIPAVFRDVTLQRAGQNPCLPCP